MSLFNDLVDLINIEYQKHSYSLGWRFLACSKNRIEQNNGIFLVSLNPAGCKIPIDHPFESSENGNSYLIESWDGKASGKAPLQIQIQQLFNEIGAVIGQDQNSIINNALVGHFIPFRSPRRSELENKADAYELGYAIWNKIISHNIPEVIICIDTSVPVSLEKLLLDKGYNKVKHTKYNPNWEPIRIHVKKYRYGDNVISLIQFPHPSTFKIFNRLLSKSAIKSAILDCFSDYRIKT